MLSRMLRLIASNGIPSSPNATGKFPTGNYDKPCLTRPNLTFAYVCSIMQWLGCNCRFKETVQNDNVMREWVIEPGGNGEAGISASGMHTFRTRETVDKGVLSRSDNATGNDILIYCYAHWLLPASNTGQRVPYVSKGTQL